MNKEIYARSIGLLGEDNFNLIQDKVIAIFGLGGVGGTCLEALARTGFKHFIIVDFDKVDSSNLNRQILYAAKDIGRNKVDAAKDRILSINEEAVIEAYQAKAQEKGIPHIMSLGMANRFDPSKVKVAKLNQTHSDPLAKKIRYMVKKQGLETSNVNVIISEELPQKNGEILYSTMMVPSSAGLSLAKFILESIIDKK